MKASILVYSLLASFFYFPTLLFAETSTFNRLFGVDLFGNDLTAMGIKGLGLAECEAICSNDEACKAYSFIEAKRWCFPKYDVGNQTENFSVISGVKTLPACPLSGRLHKCFGTWSNESGYTYTGEWLNNKQHGQGTATGASGDKYVGGFVDGSATGKGSYTYGPNSEWAGDKYVGDYENWIRSGIGTYTFGSNSTFAGDKYVGEFKNDRWNGQGTYIFADGSKYVGSFVDGSATGKGSYTYGPNSEWAGDTYVGDYENWIRSGIGTYTFGSNSTFAGDKYVGEFKNDRWNGQGTYFFANGAVQEGIWKDGKYQYDREIVNPLDPSLVGKCSTDPKECTPKKICEFATDQDGSNIVWSDASNKRKHVRFAQSLGMTCGVITAVDQCDLDPNECKISQLCEKATTDKNGWMAWNGAAQAYVDVAKEYGLNCSVKALEKKTCSSDARLCTDQNLCAIAASSSKKWSTKSHDKFYVDEAKKRGLTCGTVAKKATALAVLEKVTCSSDAKVCTDQNLCAIAASSSKKWSIKNHDKFYVDEAKKRGLTCGTMPEKATALVELKTVTQEEKPSDAFEDAMIAPERSIRPRSRPGHRSAAKTTPEIDPVSAALNGALTISDPMPVVGAPESMNDFSDLDPLNCPGNYSPDIWSNCMGQRIFSNGSQYVGQFVGGLRHGQGSHTYSNGAEYVGNWANDKRHGQGIFEMKTALMDIVQDGLWENDVFQGENKMETPARNELGQILCVGSPHEMSQLPDVSKNWNACLGEIRWEYSGGGSYVGEFENGAWHGQGTFKQGPNEEYVGEWQNNQPHGQGTYTYADGTINTGQWKNGVFQN